MEIPNLTEVEAWKGGVLDYGRHAVTVLDYEEGTSTGGHPELRLRFGNDDGSIQDWIVMTSDSLGKLKSFLIAVGLPDVERLDRDLIVGRHLSITVGPHKTPAGGTVARVKAYHATS